MSTSASSLKLIRQIHLYLGVFIAPALLFFAFTGALQTFSLHETTRGSSYTPPAWIVTLGQLHKHQTTALPAKKPHAESSDISAREAHHTEAHHNSALAKGSQDNSTIPSASSSESDASAPAAKRNPLPLKIFFLLVAVGLFTSTLTGLFMAYKFKRSRLLTTGLLLAGIILPVLLSRL